MVSQRRLLTNLNSISNCRLGALCCAVAPQACVEESLSVHLLKGDVSSLLLKLTQLGFQDIQLSRIPYYCTRPNRSWAKPRCPLFQERSLPTGRQAQGRHIP